MSGMMLVSGMLLVYSAMVVPMQVGHFITIVLYIDSIFVVGVCARSTLFSE